jgi:hypothetical protein
MTLRPGAVQQVLAILCAAIYFSVLLHKACVDLSGLAAKYPGMGFWRALGRYLVSNLAA